MRYGVRAAFALCACLWVSAGHAQQAALDLQKQFETQIAPLLNDVDVILLQGPDWLAARLPAMQASGDIAARMDLYQVGDFSLGMGLTAGLFRGFYQDISSRWQAMPNQVPEPLPMPAAVFYGRGALSRDLEVDLRYGFFPTVDLRDIKVPAQQRSGGDLQIAAGTSVYAAKVRHRTLETGSLTLVSSAEVNYFTGFMQVGQNLTFHLGTVKDQTVNAAISEALRRDGANGDTLGLNDPISLGAFFTGAPVLGWDIYQLSLEERAVWDLSWFHPFLGVGLDLAGGHVDSGVDLEVGMSIDSPPAFVEELQTRYGTNRESLIPRQNITVHTVSPRGVGFRTLFGMEFDLGSAVRFALGGMYDVTSGTFVSALGFRYAHRAEGGARQPPPVARRARPPKVAAAPKARGAKDQARGRAEFKRKNFRRALEYFQRAHKANASLDNVYLLARTEEELGHARSAIRWFERYVSRAPKGPKRAGVKRRLAALKRGKARRGGRRGGR